MELVFIRHGQPEWDIDGRTVQNPRLTEVGLEQAALLGESFEGRPVDRILVTGFGQWRGEALALLERAA